MKQIIDRVRYDTEKAELVARFEAGNPGSDYGFTEELYVTRNGTWFVAGSGGPPSPYGREVGGILQWGSKITPLASSEAREWLELHDKVQALEDHFGDEIEDA